MAGTDRGRDGCPIHVLVILDYSPFWVDSRSASATCHSARASNSSNVMISGSYKFLRYNSNDLNLSGSTAPSGVISLR